METFNMILSSSGFNDVNNYVSKDMWELFRKIANDKKVMILANAAPEGTGNYVARNNVRYNFLKVGATIVDIVDLTTANINSLLDYDVIYGLGGDPTFLIQLNKSTNFKKRLVEFLKKGIYIGESAGSMILCDDLKWAYIVKKGTKPKYDVELDTYEGLGLTRYKVFPHYNTLKEEIKEKVSNYEKEHNMEFTKLNDGEYITISYESI